MDMTDTPAVDTAARRIAGEVRAEMFRQRVSQRELARRTGLLQQRLSRRLTGDVEFRASELETIAEALDVPVSRFLPSRGAEQVAA